MEYLESAQSLRFQRRLWTAERVGWALLAIVVLAAAAGVFGRGPASSAERASVDGTLAVAYERFVRAEAPTELRFALEPALARDGRAALWVSSSYLAAFRTESIEPEPERVELDAGRTTFFFATSAAAPVTVRFRLTPETPGRASGAAGAGSARVAFEQFVYP